MVLSPPITPMDADESEIHRCKSVAIGGKELEFQESNLYRMSRPKTSRADGAPSALLHVSVNTHASQNWLYVPLHLWKSARSGLLGVTASGALILPVRGSEKGK